MMAAGAVLPLLSHPGPGCPLRALTGIPCPLCGMSTSVEATVHLRPLEALAANPAGLFAVIAAVALVLFRPARLEVPAWVLPVVLALMWVWQLFRFSVI